MIGVYDLLTLGVAVVGYAMGQSRGFAWQVSGLVTLIGGAVCATVLARPLGPVFGDGVLGGFAAWIAVYAAVATSLYVLTLRFKDTLEEIEFDELDARFGGLLGGFKALAAFGVVSLVAVPLSQGVEGAVKGSVSGRGLRAVVHEARPLLPEPIHAAFGPYLDRVQGRGAARRAPARAPAPTPASPAAPSVLSTSTPAAVDSGTTGAGPTSPLADAPASPVADAPPEGSVAADVDAQVAAAQGR